MGHIEAMAVGQRLPDGRTLFSDVSCRVGDGAKVALVGPNGAGKTTLLRMVAGELTPVAGSIARSGGLGVMRQFIGSIDDDSTLTDLALSLAPPAVRAAGERLRAAERVLDATERSQLRYADALTGWGRPAATAPRWSSTPPPSPRWTCRGSGCATARRPPCPGASTMLV